MHFSQMTKQRRGACRQLMPLMAVSFLLCLCINRFRVSQYAVQLSSGVPSPMHVNSTITDHDVCPPERIVIVTMCLPPKNESCMAISDQIFRPYAKFHGYSFLQLTKRIDDSPFPHFSKVAILQQLLFETTRESRPAYDYALWVDSDACIMEPSKRIEDLLLSHIKQKDVLLTADFRSLINTGVFLLKRSEWTNSFLDRWYATRYAPFHANQEQGRLLELIQGCAPSSSMFVYQRHWLCFKLGSKLLFTSTRLKLIGKPTEKLLSRHVTSEYLSHIHWLPQRVMNAYGGAPDLIFRDVMEYSSGDWIVHCPHRICGPRKDKLFDVFIPLARDRMQRLLHIGKRETDFQLQ